ncbi:MAG: hypothetical protein K2J61_05185 [Clostridia bacterium]|nr:hypothetical protein [Clostridia bacterium]
MKVIDVICSTMRLVGRSDAADQIESAAAADGAVQEGEYGADGEQIAVETPALSDEVKRLNRAFLPYPTPCWTSLRAATFHSTPRRR